MMAGAEGAGDVARPGCGLGGNLDVAVCRAEWLLHQGACQARTLPPAPCVLLLDDSICFQKEGRYFLSRHSLQLKHNAFQGNAP